MRDTVFQKFFGCLGETEIFVKLSRISLRFYCDNFGSEFFFGNPYGFANDLGAKPAAAVYGDYTTKRNLREGNALR